MTQTFRLYKTETIKLYPEKHKTIKLLCMHIAYITYEYMSQKLCVIYHKNYSILKSV